jgi:hypothetical protein
MTPKNVRDEKTNICPASIVSDLCIQTLDTSNTINTKAVVLPTVPAL